MIKYTKNFTPLFITPLLLSACGGGENTNIYTLESTLDQDVISSTQISGTAVKGVIKKGKVSAYGFVNGQINDLPLATSYTDSQGRYSLVIDNYNGPLFIEVSANSDTTMTCDIIDGCNGFLFSEDIPLDDEFNLKTAIPLDGSKAEIIANATVITTLAAELAEKYNNVDEIVIQNANTHVANLLKINGDITNIDTIDIFKPSPTISLDSEAKETSILNSALISAALKKNNQNKTISEALYLLIDEFIKNDGQMMNHLEDGRQSITLSNIFDEALEMVNHPALNHSALNTTKGNFLTLKEFSRLNPGELTNISPNELQKMNDVDTAKHMIINLKQLAQQAKKDSDSPSATEQLNLVTSFGSDEKFKSLTILISKASKAFLSAFDANKIELETNNTPLNQYIHTEDDGGIYPVDIEETEDGFRYQIDSSIVLSESYNFEIDYNLIAEVSVSEPEVETTYSGRRTSLAQDLDPSLPYDYFNDQNAHHIVSLPLDDERQTEITFMSANARNGINYKLNLSGELSSPDYNMRILNGDVDANKYIDLSAWFAGQGSHSQNYEWDYESPSTPLLYLEVSENDDLAMGSGLALNLDLDIETNQVNNDNPIAFLGRISFSHDALTTFASYNRCVSRQIFTEDLPILDLGINPEDCISSNEADPLLTDNWEDRPLYMDDLAVTGSVDSGFFNLSGELEQNENSVKAIFSSSGKNQRDSWASPAQPGDINHLNERTSNDGIFDSISGSDELSIHESFIVNFDELVAISSSTPVWEPEIILNNQDPNLVTAIKDLLNLDTINLQTPTMNQINMFAVGVELQKNTNPVISEIRVSSHSASHLYQSNYSIDLVVNSHPLNFDITYVDAKDELNHFGSSIKQFENLLEGIPSYELETNISHDFLYNRERHSYLLPKLSIRGENNVQLNYFEMCPEFIPNCTHIGTVMVGKKIVATIEHDEINDSYLINYSDGTSELFEIM